MMVSMGRWILRDYKASTQWIRYNFFHLPFVNNDKLSIVMINEW